jgi:multidrug efflux system membrane fusion protein
MGPLPFPPRPSAVATVRTFRRFAIPAVGVAVAVVLGACSRPAPQPDPVRSVKLMTVAPEAVSTSTEYAGEVRARVESRLSFRVGGKLTARPAEPGQRVRAGQLLAQLDPQDLQLASTAAQAQVRAAQTQRDLAQADFQRFKALREQSFISSAELERREATLRSAQATLEQSQAQMQVQGNQAVYTRLLADGAGVVTAVDAEVGQVVAAGAPVVRLALDGPRDVVFAVPEDRVASVTVGQRVLVRPWGGGEALAGTVRELAASADPVTRTFGVKVAIAGERLPPLGATVTVVAQRAGEGARAEAIRLPTSALWQAGKDTAVWVFDPSDTTVRSRTVQIGGVDGNRAVVAGGLQPGDQVVVAGVHVLAPGQKVTVYKEKQPIPSAERSSSAIEKVSDGASPAASAKR